MIGPCVDTAGSGSEISSRASASAVELAFATTRRLVPNCRIAYSSPPSLSALQARRKIHSTTDPLLLSTLMTFLDNAAAAAAAVLVTVHRHIIIIITDIGGRR